MIRGSVEVIRGPVLPLPWGLSKSGLLNVHKIVDSSNKGYKFHSSCSGEVRTLSTNMWWVLSFSLMGSFESHARFWANIDRQGNTLNWLSYETSDGVNTWTNSGWIDVGCPLQFQVGKKTEHEKMRNLVLDFSTATVEDKTD